MAVKQPKQPKRVRGERVNTSPRDPREQGGMYDRYASPPDDMNNFDPECAICGAPPAAKCGCESIALDKAIRMAEERMMASHFLKIRDWVRLHAQDYILKYYEALSERKKDDHARNIEHLQEQAFRYYGYPARVSPQDMMVADHRLKVGLDECWKASVNRYPEVLEYYYSLVKFSMPANDDPAVCDPTLSALAGARPAMRAETPLRREPRRGDRRSTPVPETRPRPARSGFSGAAYDGYR